MPKLRGSFPVSAGLNDLGPAVVSVRTYVQLVSAFAILRKPSNLSVKESQWQKMFRLRARQDENHLDTSRRLNLHHAGVEPAFRRRPGNIAKKSNEHVACLVRLNDGINPTAGRTVPNIGLFFVTRFYFGA